MAGWAWIVGAAVLGLARPQQAPETVYLFDCAGRVQAYAGGAATPGPPVHVSRLDASLPDAVSDGCAIHSGAHDPAEGRLLITVQTRALAEADGTLPIKRLALRTPALAPDGSEAAPDPPRPPSPWGPVTPLPADLPVPFERSAAYLLDDGSTLLLQELRSADGGAGATPSLLQTLWREGVVELRRPRADATGRYGVLDLARRELRGELVTAAGATGDHRVVCFTPGGRIYLAAERSVLLVLDTAHASASTIRDVELDVFWTACASGITPSLPPPPPSP